MKNIFLWINLPCQLTTTIKNIFIQKFFLKKHIQPLLNRALQQNDGSLDKDDFRKITHYYGLAVPAILGEAICILHNKKMSSQERLASTSQGAMTGLFDDFFDKEYLSDEAIQNLLATENLPPEKYNEKLFALFYRNALQHVDDKKLMLEALTDVYKAQLESKKQVTAIDEAEISRITFYKGGASLLFYRSAFLPPPSPAEKKLLYDLGSMMQLANDIFDVYKDNRNKIRTMVTEAAHIDPIRQLLKDRLRAAMATTFKIGFSEKNIRRFYAILSAGIFSRTFVCLDQLEKNELLTRKMFSVNDYSRKQLVCDMDTQKNMLRAAQHHVMLMKMVRSCSSRQ